MLSKEEVEKLKAMHDLFNKAEDILITISKESQEKILDFHNESHTLQYCIRWGLNGISELLEESE